MQQARTRTESMVQRFAKKPISEGYELWDRDYPLGALRLFTFKSETAPPFLVAPCMDSMAELCARMRGFEDACEQYREAADKYTIIQQPVLAALMRHKQTEVLEGTAAALKAVAEYMAATDPQRAGGAAEGELKTRSALARCYAYWAELLLASADAAEEEEEEEGEKEEEDEEAAAARAATRREAEELAALAVKLGWDRVHVGYLVLGDCRDALGDTAGAAEAYEEAVRLCPHYVEALERLIDILRAERDQQQQQQQQQEEEEETEEAAKARRRLQERMLELLSSALEAHPRAALAREKAFLLSELQGDAAALQFLDAMIADPPVEEMANSDSASRCVLHKARAAVLADGERLAEALEAARAALEAEPGDAEAQALADDISAVMEANDNEDEGQ